ncbi:MAG: tetratricopeptide repeat protein, partial [Aeoliella sp.]
PEPFLLLAGQSLNNGQLIQAMALYDKAIGLIDAYDENPRRKRRFVIRSRTGRSAVHTRWRDWESAEADIRTWIEADPEDGNALNRLGTVLFMLGKEADGFKSFESAKKLNEDFPPPYVSAASLYHQLATAEKEGEAKRAFASKAKQAFERAYQNDKDDKTTVIAYGDWLAKTGDLAAAEKVLAAGRQAHPSVFQIFLLSGVVAQMTNNPDDAKTYFNQTLAIAPGNRDAYNQLALVLINSNDPSDQARAEQIARMNSQLNPNSGDVNITLTWVLRQMKKGSEANKAYQKGIRLGNLSSDSSFIVAKLLLEQNRSDAARGLLENALNRGQGIFVNRAEAEALLETLK